MHPRIIHNQVDLILFEEGRFSVISWLLREGHVEYSDYQQWRNGAIAYLEKHFTTSREAIFQDLKHIQEYAVKLKLETQHHDVISSSGHQLRFSHNPEHERLYTAVFEPGKNRAQMDLFFDSSPACTANDLAKAIINQRSDDIALLLKRLQSIAAPQCRQFEQLLDYQQQLQASTGDNRFKVSLLEKQLAPLAYTLFGSLAQDYLTALWRSLAAEYTDLKFAASMPEYHASYAAYKSFQWRAVADFIERETNWRQQPDLLFRHAEACFKLHDEWQGLVSWFRLFLYFTNRAVQWIANTGHRLLFSDWQDFQALDPELQDIFFPAWLLLKKPALATHDFVLPDCSPGVEAFQLVSKIVSAAVEGGSETSMQWRVLLKQHYPELFTHLLDSIEKIEKKRY